jgi:hypothetical protein
MPALIQEALRASTTLGFQLTRIIAHAGAAVDDRPPFLTVVRDSQGLAGNTRFLRP